MPADLNYLLQARRNRYTQPAGGTRASSQEDPRAAVEEEAFQAEQKRLAMAAKEQQAASEEAARAYDKGRKDADKEALRVRNNEMEAKARREKRPIYTDADGVIQSQYTDEEWQAQKERKAKNDQLRTQYFKENRPWVEDDAGNMVPRHTDEAWKTLQAEKLAKEKAKQLDEQAKDYREQKGAALTTVDDQAAQVMRGLDLEGQDLTLQHKSKLDTVRKANAQIKKLQAEIDGEMTETDKPLDSAAIDKRKEYRDKLIAERDKVQAETDAAEAKLRAHEVRKLEYSRANNEVQGWLQKEKHGLKTEMPPVVMGVKGDGAEKTVAEGRGAPLTVVDGGLPEGQSRNQSRSHLASDAPSTEVSSKEEAVRRAVIEGRIAALAEDDSLSDEERKTGLTKLMLQRDDPKAYEVQVMKEFEGLAPEKLNEALDGHLQDFDMRKQDWQSRRDALRQQTQAVNAEVDGVLARNAQRLQQPHKAADLITYTKADGGKVSVFKDLAPQLEQAQEKAGTFEKQHQAEMDQITAEGGELERAAKLIHAGGGVLQKKQEGARVAAQAERQKVYEQLNAIPGAKLGDELAAVDAAVAKHQGGDDVSLHEWAAKEKGKILQKAQEVQKKVGPAVQEAYAAASAKMPAGVDLNGELDRDPLGLEGPASESGVTKLLEKMGLPSSKENREMAVKLLRDAAVLDWSRGNTSAPVRTDSAGRVLVNPERWTDDKAYAEAVAGAGASEAEKAKALEMQPELKAQAIKLKLDTLRTLGVFNDWEQAEVEPTREEKMEAEANGTTAEPRQVHAGLSDEEKLKLFEKENSGVFSTGAWKVRWNQALLGVAQGVIGLGQSVTGLVAPFSDRALEMNQRLGKESAQMGAGSQALPTGQWVNQGASMLVSSAPALAVGGAVGAATRSETLALHGAAAGAGLQTFGQVYGDAVQGYMQNKGLTKAEARKAALVPALASGVSTYALTAAGGTNGMESVLRQEGFKQGLKQWLATVGKGALKEGVLEEGPDQLIQGVLARHSYDPTKSWGSIWEETVTAVIGGALMGGGFEMMSGAGGTSQNGKGMEGQRNGGVQNQSGQAGQDSGISGFSDGGDERVVTPAGTDAGGQSQSKPEARATVAEAQAELASFAPEGMAGHQVAATKAKAEVLLRMAQGETLKDFTDEELRQVGLNRDGTPGHYETVPVDKKDPQAGRTSVWKKGVRADGFQPVVVEDGELIITQRQIDNLGVRLPAVAAQIGKSEVERRREIKEAKTVAEGRASTPLTVVDGGLQKPEGKPEQKPNTEAAASPVAASPEPAKAGTTLLPEVGDQSQSPSSAKATEGAPSNEPAAGFDPVVEARVDEIGAELAGRGLSGEQALKAARGVVGRMGVMGPKYEVQMIDPAFEEAMKAEGFQRDPAKMSRWIVRGQFKAETRGEKPAMRKAEAGTNAAQISSKGMGEQGNGGVQNQSGQDSQNSSISGLGTEPEPPKGGTTVPGVQSQSQSQSRQDVGAPSTEVGGQSQSKPEARATVKLPALIERSDWKQAQGEVIGVMQGRAKGLPEAGKKAASDKIKAVVKRFNKLEELIDTKFGRLFEGVRIVPNGSLAGGGLAAQVTGYDAQGRATGVELVVDAATFAEAGGITDGELERALNEEWQHRADLMVMSRDEAIQLARDIHAAQPGVFNSAWKQYYAVQIKDGSMPAKPPVELTDDEAYTLYFEASRMIRQGTFTSENAAIRDVGLLQRMYLMLSRYVNFVRREMKKLPQDLKELWEDKLTAAESVMRKTKEAGIRLQKEGLDDVEPPETAQPKKAKAAAKAKPVNEDEEAMAMAADAEMDIQAERKGALRNPGENAIRGMAVIPDPDNSKENVVVWINRYHGRITRPSKGWLARMAQDGKDRSKIGDWDDIRQADIPSFYAGLVFKNGNGSTLDQALQELHGAGYFPGVAEEDVTGEMLARKIKDVIQRYQGQKQGGATTVQDEEQAHFERMEKQRVEFERSTAKGPIYVKPHEMQPGDVMMVKADDGKMHRVEVLRLDSEPVPAGEEFDPDANPAQYMGPDGPMEIRSVTLKDGTTFGVQTIDGQQGLYVDAFSVRQEGDFYAGLSDAVQNRRIDDADAVLHVMQHEGMDATTPFAQIVLAIQQNLRVPMRRAQKMLAQVMDTEANATVWTNEELKQALESPLGSPKKQAGPGLFGEDEMNFLGDRNTLGLFEQAGRKDAQVSGKGMKEQGNAGAGVGGGQDSQNSSISGLKSQAPAEVIATAKELIPVVKRRLGEGIPLSLLKSSLEKAEKTGDVEYLKTRIERARELLGKRDVELAQNESERDAAAKRLLEQFPTVEAIDREIRKVTEERTRYTASKLGGVQSFGGTHDPAGSLTDRILLLERAKGLLNAPAGDFSLATQTPEELKAEAERKVLREKLQARAEKPLVGTLGDIGQTQMFGGGDLFAQPSSLREAPPITHVMPDGYVLTEPGMNTLHSPRKRAYHGTPHKVDKFSLDKIGTGEGAQAYGWGLYFAGNKAVAQQYQKGLTERDFIRKIREEFSEHDDQETALEVIHGLDLSEGQRALIDVLAKEDWWGFDFPHQAVQAAIREPQNFDPSPDVTAALEKFGNLYTVDLLPEEEEFLDWDKPLSEQSEKVKVALSDLIAKGYGSEPGSTIYNIVTRFAPQGGRVTPEYGSAKLASLGIPGIRYLDGGSRVAGVGTHNYVLFDEKLVRILEENGKPVEKQVLASPKKQRSENAGEEFQSQRRLKTSAPITQVDQAAHEAATSPRNDLPEPTAAQKEEGNYKLGHVRIGGHEISIENPAGSRRVPSSAKATEGEPAWPVLKDHYGYLKGTVGQDGDHVDVFVKPGTPADYAGPVHVVRQNVVEEVNGRKEAQKDAKIGGGQDSQNSRISGFQKPELRATGKLDEYKVMMGYATAEEARAAYLRNYTKGWPGLGKLTTHTMPEFEVIKRRVFGGDAGARATDKALASPRKQGQGGGMADPDKAAQNAEPSPGGLSEAEARTPMTIYRAGDSSENGVKPWASFTPDEDTAKSYTDNPGFGGSHLRSLRVDAGNVLDLTGSRAFEKLASTLGYDSETAQEWRDNGWNYPWEESSKVKRALQDSEYDAVKYTDDFPAGATTIIFTRPPAQIDTSFESARAEGGTLGAPRKQAKALEMMAKADWGRIDKALTGRLATAVTDAAQWIKKQALPGEAQVNPVDAALELLAGWSVEGQAAASGATFKPAQKQELMAQTRRQLRRVWTMAVRQLVPDASLPADVLAKKREMTMNQGLSNEVALDIGKRALAGKPKLSDLVVGEAQQNPEIRRKMFLAMNPRIDSGVTMESLNPEERRVAEALLKLRDDLGKRMVKAGRIGLQTYEAMREGTSHYYDHDVKREKSLLRQMSLGLRNLFAQTATAYHIVDTQTKQPDGSPALVMHPGSRNRPTYRFDTQEQMRGFYEEFLKDQILQAAEKGNAVRYPWMTPADKAALMGVTRDSLNNPGRMNNEQRAVVSRLQEQLRARFEKRMPLSYDEHSKAGLIEDPFYSVARQIAEMGHDVATAEFFNSIAAVPDYVRDAPTIGYTEMPDTAKLGALAGKYVRDDVAAEVQQLTELPGLGMKFYDALLGLFKTGKTVLNPGSHGRNIVGNIAFAHLAGSNPLNPGNATYYADALRVLRDGGEAYREMYENGVLGGDFLTGEVKRSLRQLVPDAATVLREAESGNMTWLYGLKEHMARRWQGLLKKPGQGLELAATAWRLEDDIYKAAAYLKAKGMGMTSKEAAEHVREWFPYYDKGTSGTLKALGRFAFPFLSFKRESFRILKNGLTKKPLATIATLALPRLLTQIALTMGEMRLLMWGLGLGLKDERDKEEVLKALKGRAGRLLSPIAGDSSLFSILLPWRDDNGGLQQWDLSNTHPFGDWLATRTEDAESKEPWITRQAREMVSGSPFLGLLVESAFNKDSFTGRRIYEDDMSTGEAHGKLLEHAFTELAPPIAPTIPLPGGVKLEGTSARTIRKAFEQSPSKLAPARNPTQALIRTLVGLDVRPADPNLYDDVAKYREKNKLPAVARGQQFPSDAVGRARAELYRVLIQPEPDVEAVKAQLEVLTKHGAKIPSVQDLFKDRQPQDVMRLKKHQARWMNQLAPEARRVLEAAQAQQSGAKPKALDAMAKARAGG